MIGKQIASIEMSARLQEELTEKKIATILKLYKMDRPLPKHIKDDIDRVLDNIGWSCWFVDYLNHRIYCWVLEITANRSNPELEEFVYWEDIQDSDSEDEEEEEDEDKCKSCGWRSEYPESHIAYCGGDGCEYIRDKYKTWINEDGELEWKLKDEDDNTDELTELRNIMSGKYETEPRLPDGTEVERDGKIYVVSHPVLVEKELYDKYIKNRL
jgi:hypothetical protein